MNIADDFKIIALSDYKLPNYPTYKEARIDPSLLKRLPNRWKKNMAALACVGLLSMTAALGGCFGASCGQTTAPYYPNGNDNGNGNGYNNDNGNGYKNGNGYYNGNGNGYENGNGNNNGNLCIADLIASGVAVHHGGSGGPPLYVVYLTEQEALQVIRYKSESLGLPMRGTPPDVSVIAKNLRLLEWGWDIEDIPQRQVKLGLFNEEKNIAFSHVAGRSNWWDEDWGNREIAQYAQGLFEEKEGDRVVKVFHGTEANIGNPTWIEDEDVPNAWHPVFCQEQKIEATQILKQHLKAQVREFIEWLQTEGIIQ